jgi:hypothetical protein
MQRTVNGVRLFTVTWKERKKESKEGHFCASTEHTSFFDSQAYAYE